MRNDHLMIVTDAGVTLHLGWDYNAPYTLDPLTGVDVDLQTAQSLGQLGTTVERQSVGGVSRTLSGCFWGPGRDDAAQPALLYLRHPLLWRPGFYPVRGRKDPLSGPDRAVPPL